MQQVLCRPHCARPSLLSPSCDMVVHTKERCTSCGVWKDMQRDCYHCTTLPNRRQVMEAKVASEGEVYTQAFVVPASPQHSKERCPSCGVWKVKRGACYHCAPLPNREQAVAARLKRAASVVEVTPPKMHTKERCPSCGVWKSKMQECYHCSHLPNRLQVRKLQHYVVTPLPIPKRA